MQLILSRENIYKDCVLTKAVEEKVGKDGKEKVGEDGEKKHGEDGQEKKI